MLRQPSLRTAKHLCQCLAEPRPLRQFHSRSPQHPRGTGASFPNFPGRPTPLLVGSATPTRVPVASTSSGHYAALFHSTPSRQAVPLIPLLAGIFKASTGLGLARMLGRIALTFTPIVLIKNLKTRKKLQWVEKLDEHDKDEKRAALQKTLWRHTLAFKILMFTPVAFFALAIVGSLERTPLTGRWRVILLSPEEEDEIAAQLAGAGWYQAVGEILSESGTPVIIPPADWRYQWALDVLRRLESTIPILQREHEMEQLWLQPSERPLPPPADFPLRPRPRALEYLHHFCEAMSARTAPVTSHHIPGAPYSLMLVEKPESANAFSYGFGPGGGGGVVVFSGFLDDVLAKLPPADGAEGGRGGGAPAAAQSWWAALFGSVLPRAAAAPAHPTPTPAQTAQLAILLAHELAHLVLAHHLETLSAGTVVVPGLLSIGADILRALLFPVTMVFGPFVNDAVAQLGKVGSTDLARIGEHCTSVKQEIEADVVSARLLAHAGFDARDAVRFWDNRSDTPKSAECRPGAGPPPEEALPATAAAGIARKLFGRSHPVNEIRVQRLRRELQRWEDERVAALARIATTERALAAA